MNQRSDDRDLTPPPPGVASPADLAALARMDERLNMALWIDETEEAAGHDDTAAGRPMVRIGDYELLQELGHGGMSIVYLARNVTTDMPVALKTIRGASLVSPQAIARFERELAIAGRLRHPNLVGILHVGRWHDLPYLVMEFVGGGDLGRLGGGTIAPAHAAGLFAPIALAVQHAHEQGVIHRDLKPSNVLLTDAGEPKVCDFGLARDLNEAHPLTLSGATLGTPGYMAPEQLLGGSKRVGPAVDIYAIGVMLYEVLAGRRPFRERGVIETVQSIVYDQPPPPSRWRGSLPTAFDDICLRCLHKDPAARYPSAAALAEALSHAAAAR